MAKIHQIKCPNKNSMLLMPRGYQKLREAITKQRIHLILNVKIYKFFIMAGKGFLDNKTRLSKKEKEQNKQQEQK